MYGIDLDTSIQYLNASLRFFDIGEHHISRYCNDDILLLVFEGVLRFSEDGKQYEVSAGEYLIQQHGLYQGGERPSDAPKYLYIHFIPMLGRIMDTFYQRLAYLIIRCLNQILR